MIHGIDAGMEPGQQICAEGGTYTVDGATITIPAGALTACQYIQITPLGPVAPTGYTAYTQVYSFEPAGLEFTAPVTITMTATDAPTYPMLFWNENSASVNYARLLNTTADGTEYSAHVDRLGLGFIGNGIDYVETPDPTCTVSRLLEGRTNGNAALPSGGSTDLTSSISVFFS